LNSQLNANLFVRNLLLVAQLINNYT